MSDLTSQYIIAQEEHDYNKKYEEGTIVKHTIDNNVTTYVAKKNVPQFISILNKNYWKKIASTEEGGTIDYDNLKNKPTINGIELEGNITTKDLGIDDKFKGWYASSSALPANPAVGYYAYVKGATASDPAVIYECTTAGTWSNSGRTVDASDVQKFKTGEQVNSIGINSDIIIDSDDLVKSDAIAKLYKEVNGDYYLPLTITREVEHSSNSDRVQLSIKEGEVFSISVKNNTSTTTVPLHAFVHYVGDVDTTSLSSIVIGTTSSFTAAHDIDSIGFYIQTPKLGIIDIYIHVNNNLINDVTNIKPRVDYLESKVGKLLIDKSYDRNGDVSIVIYRVEQGKTYRLELSSETGITFDQTYGSVDNLYEIFVIGPNYASRQKIDLLLRTGTFQNKSITFVAQYSNNLVINPSRWHSTEKLDIKLHQEGTLDERVTEIEEELSNLPDYSSIVEIHKDELELINAAKSKMGSYGSTNENYGICILQMTDSHSDWTRVERGFSLANSGYFDILLHTGDIVDGTGDFDSTYINKWKNWILNSNIPVLTMSGNHEHEYVANSSTYIGWNDSDVMNVLFNSDLKTHNGEIHGTVSGVERPYYYKDITKNGNTIRFIGLYQYEWNSPLDGSGHPIYGDGHGKDIAVYTQEQIDWLVETLQSARANNYGVIILSHSPITSYKYENSSFNNDNLIGTISNNLFARLENKYFFYEIIDKFVNGGTCNVFSNQTTEDEETNSITCTATFASGGKFIANICGHKHEGGIAKMVDQNDDVTNYPIIISVCTSASENQNHGIWSRVGERMQDCMNAIIYDPYLNKVKVVRIGSNFSAFMKEAKCYMF